jgi:hypothetical protein
VKFGVAMAVAEERKDHAHHSYEITARTTFVFALLREAFVTAGFILIR